MTTFDERDRGFENKFAHDEELAFKLHAKFTKYAGLWAAGKLGKSGVDADAYANSLVENGFGGQQEHVKNHLAKDLEAAGVTVSAKELNAEMDRQLLAAKNKVMGAK